MLPNIKFTFDTGVIKYKGGWGNNILSVEEWKEFVKTLANGGEYYDVPFEKIYDNYIFKGFDWSKPKAGSEISTEDRNVELTLLKGVAQEEAGIKVGDTFTIESVEMLDGKPYPSELGKAKVTKLSGESFAECSVSRKVIIAIENSKASHNLVRCNLIIKK